MSKDLPKLEYCSKKLILEQYIIEAWLRFSLLIMRYSVLNPLICIYRHYLDLKRFDVVVKFNSKGELKIIK